MTMLEISHVAQAISALAVILAAIAAWRALWVYRRQVQATGLATLQRFMEDRRREREQIMRAYGKCESGREPVKSDNQCLQTCKHHVACDFSDMGALLFHGLAPLGAALDIWGETIEAHYDKWLRKYIYQKRKDLGRDRYFAFVMWLAHEAKQHRHSFCRKRRYQRYIGKCGEHD